MWRLLAGGLCWLGLTGAAVAGGLGTVFHPVAPPLTDAAWPCADARNHVHVVLINGLDPLRIGNLIGVSEYVRCLGYCHTTYGELWDAPRLVRQIRAIRCVDPEARVALLGYSFGTNAARCMTQALKRDGVRVDLLIYLAGDTLRNVPATMPENAGRVVSIRACGACFLAGGLIQGANLDGADNYRLHGVRHLCAPSQPVVLAILGRELAAQATCCDRP